MGETISTRWREWAKKEPLWAYSALSSMMLAFASLGIHLGVVNGTISGIALYAMIGCAVLCDVILALRRQWWWFSYWTICVIAGVIVWEIASYFFG